ncbi:hypothetical protein BD769DRAFT_1683299 [Suillus cothurnatus]|nr:hypothetical protein BD769DRAFT_1683299 [Suillus cothurnatus]
MALFNGVHYVLSSSIRAEWREELSDLLELQGATSAPPHTHLIALTGSHTQCEHHGYLHVVSEMWVQRSVVLGRRQLEQYYSPDPTMIFSGVVACATDLSPWDLEVLSAGITSLGGQWRTALTRDVTHLFALHAESDKVLALFQNSSTVVLMLTGRIFTALSLQYQTAMHFASRTHMAVLTPHWFDDSIQAGCRVPEIPYLWPNSEVMAQVTMGHNDIDVAEGAQSYPVGIMNEYLAL